VKERGKERVFCETPRTTTSLEVPEKRSADTDKAPVSKDGREDESDPEDGTQSAVVPWRFCC